MFQIHILKIVREEMTSNIKSQFVSGLAHKKGRAAGIEKNMLIYTVLKCHWSFLHTDFIQNIGAKKEKWSKCFRFSIDFWKSIEKSLKSIGEPH